ncbi:MULTISPECIES: HAD-IA family hydrolase [unclassified Streptomyces]|uniref:HAD-IA family hydrolase n=1 Tax=unclassified Streptomyces TaxID=2593676 RepID=UPI0022505302|nr:MULTISPECIES: HAD-IA family hydrolase [unclassified Streptomyces]MCX4402446.1 HAD-IA family hydrolase [Streptomyces sp. NBC_01764]MCX5182707.1 HAD-IA family hydrolase [Streptomyces sp. NBC_00268]
MTHLGLLERREQLTAADTLTLIRANLPALPGRASRWSGPLAIVLDLAGGRLARRQYDPIGKEAVLQTKCRGLILDFGGVLTTRMSLNGQAFERSEGLKPGEYFAALNENPEGVAIYAALEVGKATQEDWNRVIGGILGIDPTNLMRRALANLHPEPQIVAAAKRARAAGIKVAMLSNSFGIEPYNPYADKGMWIDFFDAVILSELEGVRKPSPVIYERALDALELTGPECVFVDDHAENLPPAESLGIRTVHHTTDPVATAAILDSLLLDPTAA